MHKRYRAICIHLHACPQPPQDIASGLLGCMRPILKAGKANQCEDHRRHKRTSTVFVEYMAHVQYERGDGKASRGQVFSRGQFGLVARAGKKPAQSGTCQF
jgi:hypothetical protein